MIVTSPIWEGVDMGTAAQLPRPGTSHLDDPDVLVVGLAEERQRTDLASLGQRHDRRGDVQVLADRLVGRLLDVGPHLLAEPALPREVEAEIARLVVRAALQRRRPSTCRSVHDVGA